ncbi:hypothetical protein B0A48_01649 [Cryoendolithus antarcticus]|uniref:Uncharacterized protein n=1 Tax=Cryoendolithus antarcticus TaxID=1507870 RepID=A0A1V8TQA3_9PEZI|nr:hypothetical protein B0A48_01649 [Cryoendolithus antarcticus]
MPSIADTKRQVKDTLNAEPDHDAILASLQDEIDWHNEAAARDKQDRSMRKRRHGVDESERQERKERHLRFRFKSGVKEPRREKRRRHTERRASDSVEDVTAAHPFPRESADPDVKLSSNTAAFQTSLFDALADDEAAQYWESVYSQPIHVYSRPTLQTPTGELESMDDESYAAYVQRKMWEKAHPEVVIERDKRAKKLQEEAEEKERRRKEFARDREREAWRRHDAARDDSGSKPANGYKYTFDFADGQNSAADSKKDKAECEDYIAAWKVYLDAWDQLRGRLDRLSAEGAYSKPNRKASALIPWPTLLHKPAIKSNIEAFMRYMPVSADGKTKMQLLKVERVRWHPDKVQQRFAGAVDEGTMKVVTGIFQIIDAMVEEERKRNM